MKKLRLLVIMILSMIIFPHAHAQDFQDLIKGGQQDANYLIKGYASPAIKAFAGGLSQGWYNTAATHNFFGADLTISVSLVGIPTSDKLFSVDNSAMSQIQLDGTTGGKGTIPTFFGSTEPSGQTLSLKADPNANPPRPTAQEISDVPSGVDLGGLKRIPIPVANLGVSLPKGIDLKFRYIPTIKLGDTGDLGLFGVAVQHDIKQHIPGVKELPFSLSALIGYTKFTSKAIIDDSNPSNVQSSKFNVSATTIQVLISKKLAVLTIYGGVGYNIAKGSLKVEGDYDVDDDGTTDLTNPIDFSVSSNSPRLTAGLRLNLGPITFHGDYTLQKYSAITAGFGISVR